MAVVLVENERRGLALRSGLTQTSDQQNGERETYRFLHGTWVALFIFQFGCQSYHLVTDGNGALLTGARGEARLA